MSLIVILDSMLGRSWVILLFFVLNQSSVIGGSKVEMDTKIKKVVKKDISSEKTQKDFSFEIKEVKTSLKNNIWFIPNNKGIVSIGIVFPDCGTKNYSRKHPSLSYMGGCDGAGKYDKYEFEKKTLENCCSLNVNFNKDDVNFFISFPSENLKESLDLGGFLITDPRFSSEYLKKTKQEVKINLEEDMKNPECLLAERNNNTLFDKNHPYYNNSAEVLKDIDRVSKKDLKNMFSYLSQENAVVVVCAPEAMREELILYLEKTLQKLPKKGSAVISGNFEPNKNMKDEHIEFDIPQTFILGRCDGFDSKKVEAVSKIFAFNIFAGCSLDSRMFKGIRGAHGLAYSASGYFVDLALCQNTFYKISTRTETAKKAKDLLKDLLKEIAEKGITKSEFEVYRNEAIGAQVVALNSVNKFVSFVLNKRLDLWSVEEIKNYTKIMRNVRYEEVNEACKKIFSMDNFSFLSIGKIDNKV